MASEWRTRYSCFNTITHSLLKGFSGVQLVGVAETLLNTTNAAMDIYVPDHRGTGNSAFLVKPLSIITFEKTDLHLRTALISMPPSVLNNCMMLGVMD